MNLSNLIFSTHYKSLWSVWLIRNCFWLNIQFKKPNFESTLKFIDSKMCQIWLRYRLGLVSDWHHFAFSGQDHSDILRFLLFLTLPSLQSGLSILRVKIKFGIKNSIEEKIISLLKHKLENLRVFVTTTYSIMVKKFKKGTNIPSVCSFFPSITLERRWP